MWYVGSSMVEEEGNIQVEGEKVYINSGRAEEAGGS